MQTSRTAAQLNKDIAGLQARAQLHATALCDISENEYALTCQHCHRDALTITNR